jgi:hypothetical protein
MDYQEFYRQLFAPLESTLGPIDRDTIFAIIGFDAGGPLNFCTIGCDKGAACVTYVSCELAVREEQQPSEIGRYELLVSCDDEEWVRTIVSEIGRMSLEVALGHGHTLNIGPWVEIDAPLQGVIFEKACDCRVGRDSFGVLRIIGISRSELEFAQEHGTPALLKRLKASGVYPHTLVQRKPVV